MPVIRLTSHESSHDGEFDVHKYIILVDLLELCSA